MVAKLQEQLLVQERDLDSRENALMVQEDDLAATKRALGWLRLPDRIIRPGFVTLPLVASIP
jgi:hypothetical protein